MKTEQDTQGLFNSLTADEQARHIAISYDRDSVALRFGSLPNPGIELTAKQIKELPDDWQTRFAKAQAKTAIKDCTLLAGEDTEVITNGSLYWCMNQIGSLTLKNLPRDTYSGRGAWVITRNGEELASGYFDKNIAW